MRILRVLIPAAPDPSRDDAWVVFDAQGNVIQQGRGPASTWPDVDRREAVVAADAVRIVSIALPPLPASRVAAAARYALEDRLATAADDSAIAVGPQDASGRVLAIVLSRELADAIHHMVPPFDRAVAESELARPEGGWRWCENADTSFVRTDDGSAFPTSRSEGDALPAELAIAMAQATRAGRAPAVVIVDRAADEASLARWERESGVPFRAGIPWRWPTAAAQESASALDLLAGTRRAAIATPTRTPRISIAFALIGVALAAHVIATTGTWLWRHAQLARLEAAWIPLAREAGVPDADKGTARIALARAYTDARHRAGLEAPADALPMLARAAPALAMLPPGALKSATFSGGAWTLEFTPLDDAAIERLVQQLASAGLGALYAKHSSGFRTRVALLR